MQIESLILFLAVVDYNSFSQAAIEKNISQSSLSKHIKGLENEYGIKLFDRKTHRIKLTKAGYIFASYAEKILSEYNGLQNSLEQFNDNERKILRIISAPVLHLYNLSELIKGFKQKWPDVQMQITESPTAFICQEIERQNFDLAFVRSSVFPPKEQYSFYHLCDDELHFVCNMHHRFAKQEEIAISELDNERFALLKPGVSEYIEGLKTCGVELNLEREIIISHNVQFITECIRDSNYVSLMMGAMADYLCENFGLVKIPLSEHPKFPLEIAINTRNFSLLAKAFIEHAAASNYIKK